MAQETEDLKLAYRELMDMADQLKMITFRPAYGGMEGARSERIISKIRSLKSAAETIKRRIEELDRERGS